MDNIKTWTGLSVEESIRITEDRDKWRKYVYGVAKPRRRREVARVRLDLHDGSCLQMTVTVINTSKMNTADDLPRLMFQPTECDFDATYIAYVQVNHYLEKDVDVFLPRDAMHPRY